MDQAGHFFLTWLHEIRHRGTFSKISLAFSRLVETSKAIESLIGLHRAWLDVSSLEGGQRQLTQTGTA